MKSILSVLAASLALASLAPTDALANPQHERMKRCNADAKTQSLKGDARKAFMSTCLKGKHDAGAAATQSAAPAEPIAQPARDSAAGAQPAGETESVKSGATPVSGGVMSATASAPAASGDRKQACSQAAAEQSLSGAKRKAFIAECSKG